MILKNASAFIDGTFVTADISVSDGKIAAIQTPPAAEQENSSKNTMDAQPIDCTGKMVWPGLFDIHTHGCLGGDFSKSTPTEILSMCSFYAKHGVTSILATTMTNEDAQYARAMGYIRQAMDAQKESRQQARTAQNRAAAQNSSMTGRATQPADFSAGARIQGIYMEGPFFGPAKKGAHDARYLRPISQELLHEYQQLSGNAIRLLALDPSLPGAIDFIRKNQGQLTISIAHTDCDYETAQAAAEAGASHVTHLFNAMRPLLHRAPGTVGAAFECGLNAEMICDGIHVHPAVLHLMFSAMPDRILLISDSINPTGLSDGQYEAGGLSVTVKDGRAYLSDGTLAGSTITLFDAVKNAVRFHVPLTKALAAATFLPAKAVGLADKVGRIACGADADLLIVNKELTLEKVMIGGKFV